MKLKELSYNYNMKNVELEEVSKEKDSININKNQRIEKQNEAIDKIKKCETKEIIKLKEELI